MISIKAIPRGNPQDVTAPAKFYAHAIADGEVNLERLAYLVSNQCTVRESDCYAVLLALMHNVADELSQGRVVDLGALGRFQVGVRSEGKDLQEDVNTHTVKSAHLNFRPAKRLRDMLATLKYKLIDG
ncbi:HU family DNA-binding protein [Marixanthomonas spongiae]|uniref:DNA-binding protein n=1 Tax=Marixanthomonas spongiae TaxID=2174845 RepID=A0A2U0I5W1_9FLAO|nr:HU family DNA-binding protein [Marixanthomonas spongiae]PVW16454.1 DNA-binding protein [Marixanthomonas spongiae]